MVRLQAFVRGFQRELHSDRRVPGNLIQNGLGTANQIICRDDFVDEADAIGFLSGNRLAREDQLQRSTFSDEARQTLRSTTTGQQAQLDFGLAEFGMLGRNPHCASHCRFATATKRKAIDRGDHWLAEVFNEVQHTLPEPARLLRVVGIAQHFASVAAAVR